MGWFSSVVRGRSAGMREERHRGGGGRGIDRPRNQRCGAHLVTPQSCRTRWPRRCERELERPLEWLRARWPDTLPLSHIPTVWRRPPSWRQLSAPAIEPGCSSQGVGFRRGGRKSHSCSRASTYRPVSRRPASNCWRQDSCGARHRPGGPAACLRVRTAPVESPSRAPPPPGRGQLEGDWVQESSAPQPAGRCC